MNEEETKKYCQENLNQLFAFLKLDKRASQRELELAYEVLTKNRENLPNFIYKEYRRNFEILMTYHFNVKSDIEDNENFMTDMQHFKNIRDNIIPDEINDIFDEIEKEEELTLSDKARTILATQRINLTLFTRNLTKHCLNIFGIKLWREKDIDKVVKESCLNDIIFKHIFFELSFASGNYLNTNNIYELQTYVNGLKKICTINKKTCKEFIYYKTNYGIIGSAILEESLYNRFVDMLKNKAKLSGCGFSISTNDEFEGY